MRSKGIWIERHGLLVAVCLVLAPSAGFGQPAEGGGAAPAPAPSAGATGGGTTGGGTTGGSTTGGGTAGHGFVVTDEEDVASVYGVEKEGDTEEGGPAESARRRGEGPDTHVVKKGDTLWDICKTDVGSPWEWPRVWSYNPGVTNPHWIFPGDTIHLVPPSKESPLEPAIAALPSGKPGPKQRVLRRGGVLSGNASLSMRELGFVEEGELAASSQIVGSREEKIMLARGDQTYVEFPAASPLHAGERYTIYKVEHMVSHPVNKQKLGYVVVILGEIQVDQITEGRVARATITDSVSAIERGYRVGALARRWKNVEVRQNGASLEGYVVSGLRAQELIDSNQIIFVDKGNRDGVAEGNRFFVVRRGDGYKKLLSDVTVTDDPRYPKEVVAEVVVVETHPRTSVGYVARVTKEVRPGDRIEMRRGY